ncbi:MAG: ABC transporter ATP-binding protein [Bacteroidota bacterium]
MGTIVKVRKLRKRYSVTGFSGKRIDAVRDVSFRLHKGELLVLTGESGCGKTTLLKLIAGLEEADSGTIQLNEKLVTGPSQNLVPGHPDIKLAFQDYQLFPNLTIYHNLEQALKGYQKGYQAKRIKTLLRLCALENLHHKYPRELSGGEQQRAALARAMADEPAVLLLDEPFSNLDELTKQPLKSALLDTLRTFGTTAILVTHDSHDALTMADRVAVMRNGKLIQLDTPQMIYQRPTTPYVARFFGNANILPAQQFFRLINPNDTESAAAADRAHLSANAEVCIRMEAIQVCAREEAILEGEVTRTRFAGAYEEVEVTVGGQLHLTLQAPIGMAKSGAVLPLKIEPGQVYCFQKRA